MEAFKHSDTNIAEWEFLIKKDALNTGKMRSLQISHLQMKLVPSSPCPELILPKRVSC